MRLGGLHKSSMIDYPGAVSAVLFLSGCNFCCPYCHNPSLARGACEETLSEQDFLNFLKKRRGFLDAVVVSGGEPTLAEELPDLCRRIREMGFDVKLDTNGSRPQMLRRLLQDGLLNYVAMDLKTLPRRYDALCAETDIQVKVEESIALLRSSGIDHEFRTTCVRPFVDEETVTQMARFISGAQRYFLQRFSAAGESLDPDFCADGTCRFSEEQMRTMREIAARHVGNCYLR